MKNLTLILLITCLIVSCRQAEQEDVQARQIVNDCITAHGGDAYKKMDVSFDFRKFRFRIVQDDANFRYERTTTDSLKNEMKDVLTNQTFERTINGKKQDLSAKDEEKYREGTNSIAYFVLLPYKLSDAAVNVAQAGTIEIEGQQYDKIKVWFDKEGGGTDHTDIFCYWINQQTHTLDYLSYSNKGPRFRKATKRERVGGILFQDYDNYEIADTTLATTDYDKVYLAGKAKLLSKIEQSNYMSNLK